MLFPSARSASAWSVDRTPRWSVAQLTGKRSAVTACLFLVPILIAGTAPAQQASAANSDKQTIQSLLGRIDQLEARIARLEAAKAPAVAIAPAEPAPPASPAAVEAEPPAERTESEHLDVSRTLLKIRGFGDVTFHGDNKKGDTTSFTLGQLDLFVTSDISDKFKFLSEIVFEAGKDNAFGVDLERYLLQYSPNDYFNLSVGRYHTAIGYYNTAYHHSTWLQTATGRPFLFQFEDDDGILPIHNVGVSATGLIPSGRLGLHYVAEVGNGRASVNSSAEAVQNRVDENTGKSFNLALFARPAGIRGLQAGVSVYHDELKPAGLPNINETIVAAHAVLIRPEFEWLNEALLIRHAEKGNSTVLNTPGFYTQVSRRFGSYRPYFRYQYVNAPDAEPMFPTVGLRHGPSVGLRYDPSEWVAVKLQYDYTALRHQPSTNGLGLQVGFTF
jgi:hypothetical protein